MKENNDFPVNPEEWLNNDETIIIVDEAQEPGIGRTDMAIDTAIQFERIRKRE